MFSPVSQVSPGLKPATTTAATLRREDLCWKVLFYGSRYQGSVSQDVGCEGQATLMTDGSVGLPRCWYSKVGASSLLGA